MCFAGAWLYSVWSLAYFPIKVVVMKLKSQDVWTFLSRRRLALTAIAWLVAAPLPGFMVIALSGAGASGSHAVGASDSIETVAWACFALFLIAAASALAVAFIRPRGRAASGRQSSSNGV